jgi:hypothetical protein
MLASEGNILNNKYFLLKVRSIDRLYNPFYEGRMLF